MGYVGGLVDSLVYQNGQIRATVGVPRDRKQLNLKLTSGSFRAETNRHSLARMKSGWLIGCATHFRHPVNGIKKIDGVY